jgi:hypothetical protein
MAAGKASVLLGVQLALVVLTISSQPLAKTFKKVK